MSQQDKDALNKEKRERERTCLNKTRMLWIKKKGTSMKL
jgi:hypothetical protein